MMARCIRNFCFLVILPILGLAQGSLLLVGGGCEDDNSWSDEPYGWFVQQADSGKIINIDTSPTADFYPAYFTRLGADASSKMMQISSLSAAEDSATYKQLISAQGILIEGGDQWDYIDTWKNTLVEDALHYVFEQGGAIGGTSAGLAVLGEVVFDAKFGTVYANEAAYNPYDYHIHFTDDFLNILPNVLTDSHFHSRGRLGHLVPMLACRIQDNADTELIGIGVADKTALCIDRQNQATAYGEGSVTILSPTEESNIRCQGNKPVRYKHIQFDKLIHGAVYDLNQRQLIDPGPYMAAVGSSTSGDYPVFRDTTFSGGHTSSGQLGKKEIGNVTSGALNAWYGHLSISDGLNRIPETIIIPRLYSDYDYYENRFVGGMWGLTEYPKATTVYADEGVNLTQNSAGILSTDKMMYVLHCTDESFAGINGTRNTNYCGLTNGVLHFFAEGDVFDLVNRVTFISGVKRQSGSLPESFRLAGNFPNPFNARTEISHYLKHNAMVTLSFYSITGKQIDVLQAGRQEAGYHSISWNAQHLPSGVYFYQVSNGRQAVTGKCVLMR
ncbi:MAG: T9SS type A sorting domain-containing protein [Caldithrix sp.]|nr:T9SS type A sorting domain-containing protein [Caldithrix sp.]